MRWNSKSIHCLERRVSVSIPHLLLAYYWTFCLFARKSSWLWAKSKSRMHTETIQKNLRLMRKDRKIQIKIMIPVFGRKWEEQLLKSLQSNLGMSYLSWLISRSRLINNRSNYFSIRMLSMLQMRFSKWLLRLLYSWKHNGILILSRKDTQICLMKDRARVIRN